MAPCALLCVLAGADRVLAAFEGNHCVSCHETERLPISLGHSFEEWHASAHARAGVGCEQCHGGDPSVSDAAAAHRGVLPAMEADSMVHTRRIAATCGACHPKELAAYRGTIHARQVQERGTGATCFTCHGSMATSLPSPSELSARCGVCHKKPIQTQAALAVLAMAKIHLHRTHRTLEAAKASDPQWQADAMKRFHALEGSYREIQLAWHTFAVDSVLQKSRDVLKLTKLLDEEAEIKTKPRQQP